MDNTYEKFRSLHHQDDPLLIGNVWDAHSAKIMEETGCQALGTSSAAIANMLGYEDGENIDFEAGFEYMCCFGKAHHFQRYVLLTYTHY